MAKTAIAVKVAADVGHDEFTYRRNGEIKTLDEMLAIQTKCGEQRYGFYAAKCGHPPGTLYDKLDPMAIILSLEADQAATERRRIREGHKSGKATRFVVHASVPASAQATE